MLESIVIYFSFTCYYTPNVDMLGNLQNSYENSKIFIAIDTTFVPLGISVRLFSP